MKCFYHNDNDGLFAAACVYADAIKRGETGEYIPINYDILFPLDTICPDEKIWIVDFSISPEDMLRLLEITSNIIWIDHHATAIEKYNGFPVEIEGVQQSGIAGCELTYTFIFPNTLTPWAIRLVGDRDVWNWEFGDTTKYFHAGMFLQEFDPTTDTMQQLVRTNSSLYTKIVTQGQLIEQYREKYNSRYCKQVSYEVTFEGHCCLVMNKGMSASDEFGTGTHDYDIVIPYVFNGDNYIVSLYSVKIDVSEIAKKYGGGGHKGAAGFHCKSLPFSKELKL